MGIPRIIHQLWIGDQSKRPENLMQTWAALNPSCEHRVWTEENLAQERFFNQAQIDLMPELNGKCDLMRYELLYKYGGFFVDADTECVNTLDDFFFESDRFSCYENEDAGIDDGVMLVSSGYMAYKAGDELSGLAILGLSQLDFTRGLKAWQICGNKFLANHINRWQAHFPMKIYPSWYFIPEHGTHLKYKGEDKIYSKHYWGSTLGLYGKL